MDEFTVLATLSIDKVPKAGIFRELYWDIAITFVFGTVMHKIAEPPLKRRTLLLLLLIAAGIVAVGIPTPNAARTAILIIPIVEDEERCTQQWKMWYQFELRQTIFGNIL